MNNSGANPNQKYRTVDIAKNTVVGFDLLTEIEKDKCKGSISYALSNLASKSSISHIKTEPITGEKGNYWYYDSLNSSNME